MASKPAPAGAAPSPVTLRMQVYLYAQLATLALTAAAIPSVLIAPLAVAIPLALVAQLVVWALVAHATLTGLTLDASGLARLLANEAAHYMLFIGTFLVAVRTPMLMALVPLGESRGCASRCSLTAILDCSHLRLLSRCSQAARVRTVCGPH